MLRRSQNVWVSKVRYLLALAGGLMLASSAQANIPANCAKQANRAPTERAANLYDVFRNGSNIGTHEIRFEKSGSQLNVESKTRMRVKVAFVTAFKYDYVSKESWCGEQLVSVETQTDSNGKDIYTKATDTGEGYVVTLDKDGDKSEMYIKGALMPSNHWNKIVLEQAALFDTIKAVAFGISVIQSSEENHPDIKGDRFDVSGEYEYATYYDQADHWQGMAFYRGEKNFIEFRCTDCTHTLWPKR